ncbi:MAG: undecaprenyldiphospho-muramoylpentapeptide beta-N-acetylglucosaminyltransferase [Actinomycetaceae bacterium]|nr:undecaprenyldiphospho-muramoylpentapeptide beta-N-acetylglucosaminyltransferase [Actinomycetaceae bacterium]
MLNVVMAGGGTAGHVNPLLATAHAVGERGGQVVAVGTAGGLETTLVPGAGLKLETIARVPFPRRPNLDVVRFPGKYRGAVAEAGRILDAASADVAVGFGGFASTPLYAAARKRGIPVVIHEQNAKPGLANRYGALFAKVVALTFPSTPLKARQGQTQTVGLPLRPAIARLATARTEREASLQARNDAAQRLGVDPSLPTLLVTGGSLGAQHLNEVLVASIRKVAESGIQVVHLTGRGKDEPVREAAGGNERYHVLDYLGDMDLAYAVADLVLCRSGAGTVAELCALSLPGFFVPLPIGNGEQEKNAADVIASGGARLVRDKQFDEAVFTREVLPLVGDGARLQRMADAARGLGPVDAAERLAELIIGVGEGR